MRKLFLYFIVNFFIQIGIAQTNDTIFNVKSSQLIEIKSETDSSLNEAYQTLSKFLFFRDKNLILNAPNKQRAFFYDVISKTQYYVSNHYILFVLLPIF